MDSVTKKAFKFIFAQTIINIVLLVICILFKDEAFMRFYGTLLIFAIVVGIAYLIYLYVKRDTLREKHASAAAQKAGMQAESK
ncbi:hypothetical protein [Butyrivibrio sp. VCB2006]|uniref:hypothetical protein n=1 Tax=Butyrivibrio sp. VCB2006 TaxID=1280679 RepID=UPI0003FE1F5A|nr:hypothetical protein [Butyrivibrio sp. VCB2006]